MERGYLIASLRAEGEEQEASLSTHWWLRLNASLSITLARAGFPKKTISKDKIGNYWPM
jgi:hypothetical protein